MTKQKIFKPVSKVRKGEVISESIFKTDFIDISLYTFAKGERLSFEKSSNAKIYCVLDGEIKISLLDKEDKEVTFKLAKSDVLMLNKDVYRKVYSEKAFTLLMVTIKRREMMLKNIDAEKVFNLVEQIDYKENKIVSKTIADNEKLTMTLLAFDGKQELSTHSAPGDALVISLDGEVRINIAGKDYELKAGESVVMPANIAHAVYVENRYKMLLIVSK